MRCQQSWHMQMWYHDLIVLQCLCPDITCPADSLYMPITCTKLQPYCWMASNWSNHLLLFWNEVKTGMEENPASDTYGRQARTLCFCELSISTSWLEFCSSQSSKGCQILFIWVEARKSFPVSNCLLEYA